MSSFPGFINVELRGLDQIVTWSLTVGLSTPNSFPFQGDGVFGSMQLQSFNMTASGAAHVRVTLEDTGSSMIRRWCRPVC
jgi:hypothetical protein